MPLITTTPFFITATGTPWDLSGASYSGKFKSVTAQENNPTGLAFKDDGTKMYVVGQQIGAIYQYTLSTPWDMSTASYDSISIDISGMDTQPQGIAFKTDGTKMYIVGQQGDNVYQFSLSTAWALNTASYDIVFKSIGSEDPSPREMQFKSDGTKMYIMGNLNAKVFQYTLSTPWVVSSATYDTVSFSVSAETPASSGLFFKSDGTRMFVIGEVSDAVFQYTLSTPWVVSSATYDTVSFSTVGQDSAAKSVAFSTDGTEMYIAGSATDSVYQYSL